jgi:small GTP-binding protein
MKVYDAAAIRNVALVGHGGSGKTQLASAMLFAAAAVNRLGKVDEGTTVTDFDEEEIARKHTLSSSLAFAEWQKTKINIIDAPGFANFLSDAKSALRVVEGALLCVDAVAGVEVQTEKLWEEAASLNLPRIVAVNRLERERASLERTLESLHRDCAREIIPIQLPIGEERGSRVSSTCAHEGADICRRRQRQDDRGRRARGAGRARDARPRRADRDGGRGRRAADGDVLLGRHPHAGAADRGAARGDDRREDFPARLHVRTPHDRDPAAARRDRRLRPVAGRARVSGG